MVAAVFLVTTATACVLSDIFARRRDSINGKKLIGAADGWRFHPRHSPCNGGAYFRAGIFGALLSLICQKFWYCDCHRGCAAVCQVFRTSLISIMVYRSMNTAIMPLPACSMIGRVAARLAVTVQHFTPPRLNIAHLLFSWWVRSRKRRPCCLFRYYLWLCICA